MWSVYKSATELVAVHNLSHSSIKPKQTLVVSNFVWHGLKKQVGKCMGKIFSCRVKQQMFYAISKSILNTLKFPIEVLITSLFTFLALSPLRLFKSTVCNSGSIHPLMRSLVIDTHFYNLCTGLSESMDIAIWCPYRDVILLRQSFNFTVLNSLSQVT